MRTTINIDDDVLQEARALAQRKGAPFRRVINDALREGLGQIKKASRSRPYYTRGHDMGLRPGYSLDNIQELLSQLEGEDHR